MSYNQSSDILLCNNYLFIDHRAAKDGANIVIAAKTADPNPKLPGM